jgi:hypothetical protein
MWHGGPGLFHPLNDSERNFTMAIATPVVTVEIDGHGKFSAFANTVDSVMQYYLPTSVAALRPIVKQRTNIDFDDVHDLTALLVVLADFEGF